MYEKSTSHIHFIYCTNEEHSEENEMLKLWFQEVDTVTGTQQYHSFIAASDSEVKKGTASVYEAEICQVVEAGLTVIMEKITRYVVCEYD